MLLPELGEKYGRGAVQCKNAPNVNDAVAEALIPEGGGDSVPEQDQEGEERETGAEDRRQGIGIHLAGIHPFAVGEIEAPGFQAEHKNHLEHGDIGHELRDHSVAGSGQEAGVERYEEEVDYPRQYGTEAIDCRLAGKLFERIRHCIFCFRRKDTTKRQADNQNLG